MILLINDEEYKISEKFTISQFKELLSFDIELQINWHKIISIAFNIPIEKVNLFPEHSINLALTFIISFMSNIENEYVNKNIKELKELTLGEFIDLDVYISQGLHNTLDKIIFILYGITDDNYINEYWGGVLYYIKWRASVLKSYKNLFNNEDENEDENDNKKVGPNQIARSWYNTVIYLADENYLNIDNVLNSNIIAALNFLSYKKTKTINELRRNNKIH